jgi:hypothetical protein
MRAFDTDLCSIPRVYCGDRDAIPERRIGDDFYYTRKGTPKECLMVGFGGGMMTERGKTLPQNSLQKIKYIGEKYEDKFKAKNVQNINDLVEYANWNPNNFSDLLAEILVKKNGVVDKKAKNSVLLHLHRKGVTNLPSCDRI